jgi:uncharacterized protein
MVTADLVTAILTNYKMRIDDIHGVSHWARVMENGRRLAASTGARLEVVELFAVFHDSMRVSNGHDHEHGKRGADLAIKLRGIHFSLPDDDFALLQEACINHTEGAIIADVTVQTCWDSDRLDLARAGIFPNPKRLCTEAARQPEMIAWATQRSFRRFVPALVKDEWRLHLNGDQQ